ncbi:MAG TPA: hypothetical protein VIU14_03650 [Mesorhizobium sp.]
MRHALTGICAAMLLSFLQAGLSQAAQSTDPDWPCVQRKVPELSLGQIWNGPELPATASDWSKDNDVEALVQELAQRRIPVADAQQSIRDFARGLKPEDAGSRLTMLAQGLFDHMNAERSQVISGIGRYARGQADIAARLRKEASALGDLQAKPDTDIAKVQEMTDRLNWETRIFEERVQSLTFVCEVPTLIEQRLYALAKTVAEVLPKK